LVGVLALGTAGAESFVQGGTLSLNWKDCGDASTKCKVSGLALTSLTFGHKTRVTGSGSVTEGVSAGKIAISMKASIISKTYSGDVCAAQTFTLPLGVGSITYDGLKCPVAAGAVSVPVDILLSSALPSSLAKADITISATSTSGDKLLCMAITTAPAAGSDRQAVIQDLQSTPGILWTAGMNTRFEDMPIGASKILRGVTPAAMAKRAEHAKNKLEAVTDIELPESFDSETNWPHCAKVIGDIRDQSMCGCCWAFAAAEAASDRLCISSNATQMVPLSAQDVCFGASDDGCNGGDIDSPWDYISKHGAVTGGQYKGTGPFGAGMCQDFSLPHCHHHGPQGKDPFPAEGTKGCPNQNSPDSSRKCDSAAKGTHTNFKNDKHRFTGGSHDASGEQAIAQAIMAGGPVETAFQCYDEFENYVSGIYHVVNTAGPGGHAVKIVGWGVEDGVKYWKVANSWNPYWGEKGYFRIKKGTNEAGIEDQVSFSPANAKWSGGAGEEQLVV